MSAGTIVYFVQIGEAIKIGFTTNLKQRLRSFRTATAEEIRVLATFPGGHDLEKQLHDLFRRSKIKNEHFSPSDEMLTFIDIAKGSSAAAAIARFDAEARQKLWATVSAHFEAHDRWLQEQKQMGRYPIDLVTVEQEGDGQWAVRCWDDEPALATFQTDAEAWRFAYRLVRDEAPISTNSKGPDREVEALTITMEGNAQP